jgi:2-dehydropantoate 2-reductase
VRFVIYGAGAVGGVIGARLSQHGHAVVLIARGEHRRAIERDGLLLETPDGATKLTIPVVEHPAEIDFRDGDVVMLTMKSQDTVAALAELAAAAPAEIPVVCAQNGVVNERAALRRFAHVYAVVVMLPATHLEPGVVQASSAPATGILDVGRYPRGVDETARLLADALGRSTFSSHAVPEIMRWKYRKLLMNLGNAVEAVFALPEDRERALDLLARREGEACLRAAGIDFASVEEDRARRGDLVRVLAVRGEVRGGGSSWQSLARGAGVIEADYLNGEIVLLGRLHGTPTPVNEALGRLANRSAGERRPPRSLTADSLPPAVRKMLEAQQSPDGA